MLAQPSVPFTEGCSASGQARTQTGVVNPLSLRATSAIAAFLHEASTCAALANGVRESAAAFADKPQVPWPVLKEVAEGMKSAQPQRGFSLQALCQGSCLALAAPQPRERSPELEARVKKLQEQLDNKRYSDMVADVTEEERKAEEAKGALLPSARTQLSFGAHVLVTMFTFWAFAFYSSKWYLQYDDMWAGLMGALGLTVGLLLETVLLIIRTNMPQRLEERMPDLFDKEKVDAAFAQLREQKKQQATAPKPAGSSSSQSKAPAQSAESKKSR